MLFRFNIALFLLIGAVLTANGQEKRNTLPGSADSLVIDRQVDPLPPNSTEYVDRFYDSLATKAGRRNVSRLLHDAFFRRPRRDTTEKGQIVDETSLYKHFEGKTIGQVEIERSPIYANNTNWFQRLANNTHVITRKAVIRRDLYFKPGDKVDPYTIVINKDLLLSRAYLSDVEFVFETREDDTTVVDITILTRDKMTLALDGSWRSRGMTMVEVYDQSIIGSGNQLTLRTHFDRKKWNYEGNSVKYHIPNIMGSFYKADAHIGREFYDRIFRGSIYKDFTLPTDYDVGVSFQRDRLERYSLYRDDRDSIKEQRIRVWAGRSYYMKRIKSSIYVTGMYGGERFRQRPEVGPMENNYFHNSDYAFFGFGLFREKFYRANMIFGYGRQELIPEGFRAEIVGGYSWGEFHDEYYVGLRYHRGRFHRWGYMRGEFEIGSYIDHNTGDFQRAAMNIELKWISNLFRFRGYHLRQFVTFSHLRGWRRGIGDNETLHFTNDNGPQTLSREHLIGNNRMALSTETVFFTRFQPWGFRMAVSGFADFGLLGNHRNVFNNIFYNTFGVGVRFKNERFVLGTIQIRLGIALSKGGLIHNQYFRFSSEPRLERIRFTPGYAEPIRYE